MLHKLLTLSKNIIEMVVTLLLTIKLVARLIFIQFSSIIKETRNTTLTQNYLPKLQVHSVVQVLRKLLIEEFPLRRLLLENLLQWLML